MNVDGFLEPREREVFGQGEQRPRRRVREDDTAIVSDHEERARAVLWRNRGVSARHRLRRPGIGGSGRGPERSGIGGDREALGRLQHVVDEKLRPRPHLENHPAPANPEDLGIRGIDKFGGIGLERLADSPDQGFGGVRFEHDSHRRNIDGSKSVLGQRRLAENQDPKRNRGVLAQHTGHVESVGVAEAPA